MNDIKVKANQDTTNATLFNYRYSAILHVSNPKESPSSCNSHEKLLKYASSTSFV